MEIGLARWVPGTIERDELELDVATQSERRQADRVLVDRGKAREVDGKRWWSSIGGKARGRPEADRGRSAREADLHDLARECKGLLLSGESQGRAFRTRVERVQLKSLSTAVREPADRIIPQHPSSRVGTLPPRSTPRSSQPLSVWERG
jgi:hypothetical protein